MSINADQPAAELMARRRVEESVAGCSTVAVISSAHLSTKRGEGEVVLGRESCNDCHEIMIMQVLREDTGRKVHRDG